ncbi:uncharacterized protein LOC101461058 isoform X2 [Ceratitis capitata]|uniref:uncharacterized protein LOC101461058 isoform X2 n=1 Tax=Ceratitis capitata TaxID=7213 RepID=UPI0006188BF6|nr:uncharacterized protein LOC101461058 isoform X2 [Ceratitis capitata]
MDSSHQVNVPLRSGGKKIRKRRELDALIAHSFGKKQSVRRNNLNIHSQDKLLSASTDDAEDYAWVQMHRPKHTNSTNRCHNRKYMLCKPLLVFVAISILIGLLYWMYLDIRQEMYDYRQKIEEVAIMNRDLPDTLQKWHELSTLLLKNQTTSIIRLNDLERNLENLRINFTIYRTSADAQQNYAKEEKIVADFGAKIESVLTDMERFKDHYSGILKDHTKIKIDLKGLSENLTDAQQKALGLHEISSNYSQEVSSLKLYLRNNSISFQDFKNEVRLNFSHIWNELNGNKLQTTELIRRIENISLHLISVENNWEKYNLKFKDCEGLIHHIENNLQQ